MRKKIWYTGEEPPTTLGHVLYDFHDATAESIICVDFTGNKCLKELPEWIRQLPNLAVLMLTGTRINSLSTQSLALPIEHISCNVALIPYLPALTELRSVHADFERRVHAYFGRRVPADFDNAELERVLDDLFALSLTRHRVWIMMKPQTRDEFLSEDRASKNRRHHARGAPVKAHVSANPRDAAHFNIISPRRNPENPSRRQVSPPYQERNSIRLARPCIWKKSTQADLSRLPLFTI
jgi:hypothetical protein